MSSCMPIARENFPRLSHLHVIYSVYLINCSCLTVLVFLVILISSYCSEYLKLSAYIYLQIQVNWCFLFWFYFAMLIFILGKNMNNAWKTKICTTRTLTNTCSFCILKDNGHPTLTVNSYTIYNVYETHRAYTCTCSTLI